MTLYMHRPARSPRVRIAAAVLGGALLASGSLAIVSPAANAAPITIPLITIPGGVIDLPVLTILQQDISVGITDNATALDQGSAVVTKITISNRWNTVATGINVLYSPPLSHTGSIWACTVTPGDSCGGSTSGSGSISRSINLSGGKSAVFTISAAIVPTATGTINSTVTIVPPVAFGDNSSSNNQASDTTTINPPPTTTTIAATTTTGAATTIATTTTTANATVAPTTVAPTAAPTVAPTPAPTAAPVAADGFQSPTGGIKCLLITDPATGQTMRCTVIGSTAKLPKRPASCDFDWEDIAVNATGRAYTVCAGDSIEGNLPVLPYGKTFKRGVFTCTSAKSGVTCRNPSRRGFRVSKTKRTYL
jgi:hypothetical protein